MYNRHFLCKFTLINPKQFGFRANYLTEHALMGLIKIIKYDLGNGLYVYGICRSAKSIKLT